MKRLLTGLQPSGTLHIGNYFGALKPFTELYTAYQSALMVADYHALTTLKQPEELRHNIMAIVKDYLAIGIDPTRATIFQQSAVAAHTELTWVFNCLVSMPFLELAHAYKDKQARGFEANVGLFDYPILMAADILLYDTDIVPVGQDQRQHIEYTREVAAKFNAAYGSILVEPQAKILDSVSIVPGTDGKKMSKSYGNTIPLFGTRDEIASAVMSIVTDSSGEKPANVYAIHALLKPEADLAPLYERHQGKYKTLKEALIEDLEMLISPMREKRDAITDDDVRRILADGAEKAREAANGKMKEIRRAVGVSL